MSNQKQNQNDSAPTIDEILDLFKTLNEPAQDAAMSVLRLAGAIRAGVVPGDMREVTLGLLADAFDAGAGKGSNSLLT